MEQLPLDLQFTPDTTLEATQMSYEELTQAYKNTIGIDPTWRGFTSEDMLAALENPDAERARIMELDRASDQEDMFNTYRR